LPRGGGARRPPLAAPCPRHRRLPARRRGAPGGPRPAARAARRAPRGGRRRRRAMRAMILAAGLGTRMRPLSALRPKPALPVRGLPLVAWPLAALARAGVREAIVNLHHLAGTMRAAAEAWAPPGLRLAFSEEPALLGTGGGLRRAVAFLRESDPS